MKFTHGTRRRAAEYEKDWVQRWKDDQTFEKSVAQRPADNAYVFYDGPPFITGVPHHGTLLLDNERQACGAPLGLGLSWAAGGEFRRKAAEYRGSAADCGE